MKSRIVLCSGGARSGKSEFAESLALSLEGIKGYIATGQAFDEEMRDRIKRHQERRGSAWNNYEIPLDLDASWSKVSAECDVILIDCLTMLTTNYIMAFGEIHTQDEANELENSIMKSISNLLTQIQNTPGKTVIFVTNELGLGVVPENKLARYFRDIAGRVNREVAEAANQMYLIISGITIELKSLEVHING